MDHIDVDIWTFPLAAEGAEVARFLALLSVDERARADRFVSTADRTSYIVGRGTLRSVLASYIDCPAGLIAFRYGEAGKPALNDPQLHFNLSHSGGWAALAVCARFDIGIDIELIRPIEERLADRYFTQGEADALRRLEPDAWTAAFFRCWTRKEAVVKARGGGLNIPLKSFAVSIDDGPEPHMLAVGTTSADDAARWKLIDFTPASGVAGAVALMAERAEQSMQVTMNAIEART